MPTIRPPNRYGSKALWRSSRTTGGLMSRIFSSPTLSITRPRRMPTRNEPCWDLAVAASGTSALARAACTATGAQPLRTAPGACSNATARQRAKTPRYLVRVRFSRRGPSPGRRRFCPYADAPESPRRWPDQANSREKPKAVHPADRGLWIRTLPQNPDDFSNAQAIAALARITLATSASSTDFTQ
jgi:hypothetical protein